MKKIAFTLLLLSSASVASAQSITDAVSDQLDSTKDFVVQKSSDAQGYMDNHDAPSAPSSSDAGWSSVTDGNNGPGAIHVQEPNVGQSNNR